ncbi:MAG: SUMF1/EgtB/PvdO family nonheme iron enzyme, partial [bacterium]
HQYATTGYKTVRLEVRDTGGLTDDANRGFTVRANTAPIASFTVSPDRGSTDTVVSFTSTCTDAEEGSTTLQIRWDWESDGWDTEWSTNTFISHQFATSGSKGVRLEVRDTDGLTDDTTKVVNVSYANVAPTAFFTVTPDTGTVQTLFEFDASGCSDVEDPISVLQVQWNWDGGSWDTDWSTTKTAVHQYSSVGHKSVGLQVRDTGGLTTSAYRTVEVVKAAPVASFTVTPESGTTLTVFEFDASGSSDADESSSALQVRWDWESDGWDTGWSTTKTATHQFASWGTKTVKLEVRDTDLMVDDTTKVIDVSSQGPEPGAMVLVPAGTFIMGDGVSNCAVVEHEVTLTHPFYLGQYEVTNGEYRDAVQWAYDQGHVVATSAVVNDNMDGSSAVLIDFADGCEIYFSGGTFGVDSGKDDYPVTGVTWYGAAAYCDWLSMQEQPPLARAYSHSDPCWQWSAGGLYNAAGYRLPTEAEWEYAAQYDDERLWPWGNEDFDCSRANAGICLEASTAVGSYPGCPAIGDAYLYDMLGNAIELCGDQGHCDLGASPVTDPAIYDCSSGLHAIRGSNYSSGIPVRPTAERMWCNDQDGNSRRGFRCARTEPSSVVNTPPMAIFSVTQDSGEAGETVFGVDASDCCDGQDVSSALEVRWDWEDDGSWDTGWSTTKTSAHMYPGSGAKTVRLAVRDTGGAEGDTTATITIRNPEGMILIPSGSYRMGDGVASCGTQQRDVTLTHGFYLGKCEVTNQQYRDALQWAYEHGYVTATSASVNDNIDGSAASLVDLSQPYCRISFDAGTFAVDTGMENHPMVSISWYGAVAYCDWLSMQAGLTRAYSHSTWSCNSGDPYNAVGYRLPTDAEWEFAAQYDDERIYPWGDQPFDASKANYDCGGGCPGEAVAVGSYPGCPAVGADSLYDIDGNVWELCNDWLLCNLGTDPLTDPPGPSSGALRIARGCSFRTSMTGFLRCAYRWAANPAAFADDYGFRCARSQ